MTLCNFLPGGKKNRGKEETGLRIWPPAEGPHDAMQVSAGREEESRERRKSGRIWLPAEGKVFFETRRFCCCGFLFCVLK